MIHYIDDELRQWAQWSILRQDGGLGYPRQSNFTRIGGGSGGAFSPVIDEDAAAVEQCVLRLKDELWCVVDYWYRSPSASPTSTALFCRCHRDTVYSRLHQAHIHIMGWLNDLACDVPLPPPRASKKVSTILKKRLTPPPTVLYDLCNDV